MKRKRTVPHAREQRKIERQQTGFRILLLMIQMGRPVWTASALSQLMMDLSPSEIHAALAWLLRRKPHPYLERRTGEYYLTFEGRMALQDEAKNPTVRVKTASEWRDEALTGMDAYGDQSELERAALPSPEGYLVNNPETIMLQKCIWAEGVRTLARTLGVTVEEALAMIKTGEVHQCKGTDITPPHMGRFHKHNGNRTQWQALCIECRKEMRKTQNDKNT